MIVDNDLLEFPAQIAYARRVGAAELRTLTFHDRAAILKDAALFLTELQATFSEQHFDIAGDIATLSAYAACGRRDLPDGRYVLVDEPESIDKRGTFVARHILTSPKGVALHVYAEDAPSRGLFETLAPAFLAGVPSIVFATATTAQATYAMLRSLRAARIVPAGALQPIVGVEGDIVDHLGGQDSVAFAGSYETSHELRSALLAKNVRFIAQSDSMRAAVLGPDAVPGAPEFDIFIREIVQANSVDAIVPRVSCDAVVTAITSTFAGTVKPYDTLDEAIELVRDARGNVATIVTHDAGVADALVAGLASHHDRLLVLDRDCAPAYVGGAQALADVRRVYGFMRRTAIQSSPQRLTTLGGIWTRGADTLSKQEHPFRHHFEELSIGESLRTASRKIALDDIEHFAQFTGDTFYAHMDDAAAKANPFFPGRVAHGYLLLAFAAGLFVDPAPGPVLANYGLESLRFVKPVEPGDSIAAILTVKSKTLRKSAYGEVRWDVQLVNQNDETVATYDLLTLNATGTPAS